MLRNIGINPVSSTRIQFPLPQMYEAISNSISMPVHIKVATVPAEC
jgi:hypothetical protein